MQIVRKRLTASELNPNRQRYNVGGDTVQTLVGDTWVDTPQADPRTSAGLLLPPRTSGDPQCDAAANMTAKVKSIVDYYIATAEQALFVSGVVTLIAVFIPLVGLIAEALWALADILVGLGVVAVTGAMTADVYDALLCIFYCNMDTTGQITAAQLDDIEAAVSDQLDSIAATIINAILDNLGWVGVNNAGATGEETGDCSACACAWCYEWTGAEVDAGDWSDFDQGALSNFGGTVFLLADGAITHIEFTFTWGGDGGGGDSAAAIWIPADTRVVLDLPLDDFPSPATITWDGSETSPGDMQIGANGAAGSSTTITITNIKVKGTGTLPAWAHGHEC